jgi:hypothetical protein
MLLGFLGLIIFITLFPQKKTDAALEALRNLSSPRALVIPNAEAPAFEERRSCRRARCFAINDAFKASRAYRRMREKIAWHCNATRFSDN